MAKGKNSVDMDVNVKGKGVQKTTVQMKKLGQQTDKTSKSTGTLNRNWKGASAQSSGASKNFSKMSQGMGGIVGAYATLAANIFAIGAAFRFLKSAGDLQKLKEGQVLYASATGVALKSLANDIRDATDAQITFTDASQSAAIGKAAGLTNDQLVKLGKGAKDVSIILGRDVTDSFNRLVRGVTKAEPELLDELGIILRLTDASEKYAATVGKSAKDLTQFEKSQAVTVEVLDQLESKYGRIMEVMEPEGNQFTQLGVAFDDIVNDLKDIAQVVAGPIAATLTKVPALIVGIAAIFATGLMKSGIASWTANASARAKTLAMDYQHARAKLEDLQRTQKKRVATQRNVPAQAQKAMQGQNIFKSTSGKTYQKVMRGETLSKRDQGYINKAVNANKAAGIKMSKDWKIALKSMSAGTVGTTQKILFAFKNLGAGIRIVASGVQAAWSVALKGISAAAAATGAVLTFAMSAVAWISIIATIAMTVKQLFAVEEQADKSAEELSAAGEKVAALNQEFSKFNEVQKIITEDGQNMLAFFEALGNRIGQLDPGMQGVILEDAWEGFVNAMDPAQLETNLARIDEDLRAATKSWKNLWGTTDSWWTLKGGFGLMQGIFSPDEHEQFFDSVDEIEASRDRLIRIKEEISGNMGLWDLEEGKQRNYSDLHGGMYGGSDFADVSKETIEHMGHLRNSYRDGAEMTARLENEIALLTQRIGPADDALAGMNGNLIAYLKSSKDVTQIELGKYYEDLIGTTEIIAEQFSDAKNPARDLLDYFITLEDITLDGTSEQLEKIQERIAGLTSRSNEWTSALSNANRMQQENAQETDKLLLGIQGRSTEGRMEDTLKNEVLERLRSSFPDSEEIEKLTRDQALAMVEKVGVGFMPAGTKDEEAEGYQKRNAQLIRQIALFDMLDRRKDEATTRGLRQSLEEEQSLLGATKLVGARLKLQHKLRKNELKVLAIADERFEIMAKIDEMQKQTERDFKGEEQQLRRLEQLKLEEEIENAKADAVKRKLDYEMQIADTAKQSLESGLTTALSSLMKGEEASLKDAMLTLAKTVVGSVIDTLAKQMTEGLMTFFGGKTEAQKNQEAIEDGGETVRASWEQLFEYWANQMNQTTTQFMTTSPATGVLGLPQPSDPSGGTALGVVEGVRLSRDEASTRVLESLPDDQAEMERLLYAQTAYDKEALDILRGMLTEVAEFNIDTDPILSADQKTFFKKALTDSPTSSIFTHNTSLNTKMDELIRVAGGNMQGGFTAAGDADAERVAGIYEVETRRKLDDQRHRTAVVADAHAGVDPERSMWSKLMDLPKVDRKDEEKSEVTTGGFWSKITGFFSADSPWMTKLGDFFGAGGSFLRSIGGLFGGMGDIFGQLFGGGGFMSMLSMFGFAHGGIIPGGFRKYARGGIASSPTIGLIGEGRHNEAVVPLPNGKAIPVDMRSSAQTNNVTVNVSPSGQAQVQGGGDNEGLGKAIAKAVQDELQNQKRSGGILNPYGAA